MKNNNDFWRRVKKGEPNECWEWIGSRNGSGRGQLIIDYRKYLATHYLWKMLYGVFPTKDICHTCDNPPCVNPAHLVEASRSDNLMDAVMKGRNVKHSQEVVDKIRDMGTSEKSRARIAELTGVSKSQVSRIINRETRFWNEPTLIKQG